MCKSSRKVMFGWEILPDVALKSQFILAHMFIIISFACSVHIIMAIINWFLKFKQYYYMYYVLYIIRIGQQAICLFNVWVLFIKKVTSLYANHQYSIDCLIFLCVDLLIDRSHIYLHNRVKNIRYLMKQQKMMY